MVIRHHSGKMHSNADGLSRITVPLSTCPEYQPIIALDKLPCGGCKFCTRARVQWETFENDVDYVQSIAITRTENDKPCTWVDSLSVFHKKKLHRNS